MGSQVSNASAFPPDKPARGLSLCAKGLGHRSRALVGRRQSEGPWEWEDQPRRLGKAGPRGGSGIWKTNVSHCALLETSLPLWWCEFWQIEGFLGSNMDGSTLSCCDNWCVCACVCTRVRVCMSAYRRVRVCTVHACVPAHVHVCTCVWVLCMCMCAHACVCVCVPARAPQAAGAKALGPHLSGGLSISSPS